MIVAASALIAGCTAINGLVGAAAALSASNPAAGLAIGIGVKTTLDETSRKIGLRQQRAAQDAIARVVGDMRQGDTRTWSRKHLVGSGSDYGVVRVVRVIRNPLTPCKELLFSVSHEVNGKPASSWYATTACLEGEKWKWAAAEPAVERWGNLQ